MKRAVVVLGLAAITACGRSGEPSPVIAAAPGVGDGAPPAPADDGAAPSVANVDASTGAECLHRRADSNDDKTAAATSLSTTPSCVDAASAAATPFFPLPSDANGVFCFHETDGEKRPLPSLACQGVAPSQRLVRASSPEIPAPLHQQVVLGTCEARSKYESYAAGGDFVVCEREGDACCRRVAVPGANAHARSAVTRDGDVLVIGRNAKNGPSTVEGYDVATSRRLFAVPLTQMDHIDEVVTVGARVFVRKCVDAGPGCTGYLVDPATGKTAQIPVNLYGVQRACQPVDGDRWAFLSVMDAQVAFVDTRTGVAETPSMKLPANARIDTMSASVTRRSDDEVLYVSEGPSVVRIDLKKKKLAGTIHEPRCPK